MKKSMARGLMMAVILFGLLTLGTQTWMARAQAKGVSPESFLNADGTLKLDGNFQGTFDLSGYGVQLDPQRGPVFGAALSGNNAPQSIATPGRWTSIGDGGGNIDGYVRGIAVSGTDVYVVGDFTDAANIPEADYVAKWNGTNWSALGSNGAGNGSLAIGARAIAVSGSDVYVGGDFTDVNNNGTPLTAADRVARWDGANWSALGNNGAGNGALNSSVWTIAVNGTDVYVGGDFTNVSNSGTPLTAADYIAKWDGANWTALGSNGAGNGSLSGSVYAIAVSGSYIYVGGGFTDVNNNGTPLTAADRVAKWDGTNWSALGSDGASGGSIATGVVYALSVSGANLYVGGQFTNVNNNGTSLPAADWIAKWDGSNWSALGSNGSGNGALNSYVYSILVNGTDVFVGGAFTNISNNGTALGAADYVAKWDGANWSALGSNGASDGVIPNKSSPVVMALAIQGSTLLMGGGFYDLNNGGTTLPQADFIALWNGANWSSLGASGNGALVNGYSGSGVTAIAVMGTDVYVGGVFQDVSNHGSNIPEADYIAKWDGANWSALGSNGAGDGALRVEVDALAVSGTDLYVGGRFTNAANIAAADYIAKWNGTNWSALGSNGAGNGALNNWVNALAVSGSNIYVGGGFTNAANITAADYVAQWDGANWTALGSNGAGDGALNNWVQAIAVSGSNIYVGGGFTNGANVAAADYIAQWDGANWTALGSNGAGDGALNSWVNAIAVSGTNLYVGGTFTNAANIPSADLIAKWDGANWSALGSNGAGDGVFCVACGNSIRAIVAAGGQVFVGGAFTNLNNGSVLTAADYVAQWNGTNWSALGSNGAGNGVIPSMNNTDVKALALFNSDLLVGGTFANLKDNGTVIKEADYLAAYGVVYSSSYLPFIRK